MKLFKTILLSFFFSFLTGYSCFAQEKDLMGSPATNIDEVGPLITISEDLLAKSEYELAITYAKRIIDKCNSTKNSQENLLIKSKACDIIGSSYAHLGNYTQAHIYLQQGLQIKEAELRQAVDEKYKIKIQAALAVSYKHFGYFHRLKEEFDQSKTFYDKFLKIQQALRNEKGIADGYNNIGLIYYYSNNFEEALTCFNTSLDIRSKINDSSGIAGSYNNIAIVLEGKKLIDSALTYYHMSLALKESLNNKFDIATTCLNIGDVYINAKQYEKAPEYLFRGLLIAQDINSIPKMRDARLKLSKLYEETESFEAALAQYKHYSNYKDSLLNLEKAKKLQYQAAKFEFERMDAIKQEQVNADKIKSNFIIIAISIGFVILLVFILLIANRLRVIRKQKQIIETSHQEIKEANLEILRQSTKITDSINYAKTIQNAILKSGKMLSQHNFEHFILFNPKDVVSGDFSWAHYNGKDKLIWSVVDCTGHGVPGALMSMIGNSLLNEIVIDKGETSPDLILTELKRLIINTLGQKDNLSRDGMDMAICVWDMKTNTLEMAGANNPIYIARENITKSSYIPEGKNKFFGDHILEIKGTKQFVGYDPDRNLTFQKHTFQLEDGDIIYLSSDGYPDQFGGQHSKKITSFRFKELLSNIFQDKLYTQKNSLEHYLVKWQGEEDQVDDICVVGLKIKRQEPK